MLEWIVSSAALILAVLLLRAVFGRKMAAGLRYGLWAVVLLRLLVPVQLGAALFSVSTAVDRAGETAPVQTVRETLTETRVTSAVLRDSPLPYEEAEAREDLGTLTKYRGYPTAGPKGELHTYVYEDSLSVVLPRVLRWVWLGGIGLLALFFLFQNLRFWLTLRKKRVLLREGRPRIWAVPELASSCLFGLFRPAVYVSDAVAGEEDALSHVLAHETAHYRHGDHIWSLLRCAALALHWYNPLVWVAAALSRRDAELFADAGALSRLGEDQRESYGLTLVRLSAGYGRRVSLLSAATSMNGSTRTLRERVKRIAKSPRLTAAVLLPVLLLTLAAAGCAFLGKQKEPPAEEEKTDRVLFLSHSLMEYAMDDSVSMRELLLYENGSLHRLDSLYDLSPSTFFVRGDTAYWADSEFRAVYRLDASQPEPRAEVFASLPGVLVNQLYVTREGRLFLLYQVYNAEEGRASPVRLGELLPDGSLAEAYDGEVFVRNGIACKWITEDEENLYFISLVDLSPHGLVKLNKQTGEWTAKEDPRFWEALYYDNGFVYSATASGTPVRYRVSTGEVEELAPVGPFVPRDGRLYSVLSVPGEGQSYELARTNPETGERQSCGTIHAAYVADLVPRECLAFTDTGFIFHAISAEDGHSPLYLYFSCDGTESRELKVMKLYWEGRSRITMPAGTIWEMNLRTESERVDDSWEIWCDESLGSLYWREPLSGPAADHSLRLVLDTHSAIPEARGRLYAQKGEELRWIDVELTYRDLAYYTQPVASPESYIPYGTGGSRVYYEEQGRTVYLLCTNSRYRITSAACYAQHISVSLAEDGMSITITADDELTGDLDAQIIYDVEVDGSDVYQYKEMLRFREGSVPSRTADELYNFYEAYGPETEQSGASLDIRRLSEHRLAVSVTGTVEEGTGLDASFALFTEDGKQVMPSRGFEGQEALFWAGLMKGGELGVTLSLRYGALPPGTYRLVKRVLRLTAETAEPCGTFLSGTFTLEGGMSDCDYPAYALESTLTNLYDPAAPLPAGLQATAEYDGAGNCRVRFENATEQDWQVEQFCVLYRLVVPDRFPVRPLRDFANGQIAWRLAPGDTVETDFSFGLTYALPEPGDYVLIYKAFRGEYDREAGRWEEEYLLPAAFTVAEGTQPALPSLAEVLPEDSYFGIKDDVGRPNLITLRGWQLWYEPISVPLTVKDYVGGPAPLESGVLYGQTREEAEQNDWRLVKTTDGMQILALVSEEGHISLYRFYAVFDVSTNANRTGAELFSLLYGLGDGQEPAGVIVEPNPYGTQPEKAAEIVSRLLGGGDAAAVWEALENASFSPNVDWSSFYAESPVRFAYDLPEEGVNGNLYTTRQIRFLLRDGMESDNWIYDAERGCFYSNLGGFHTLALPEETVRELNDVFGLPPMTEE